MKKRFLITTFNVKFLVFLTLFLCIGHHADALDKELERASSRYIVEVDSQVIKATPYEITYENGREIHHDENVEWYTDMTIYEFKPKEVDEKGMAMKSSGTLRPTIFLLSGGGFTSLDNQEELNPANNRLHDSLKLASKLANEGYNVFWINYQVEANVLYKLLISFLFADLGNTCTVTDSTQAKARMEHASLKAFRDFRVKFKNIINDPAKNVDPDNVFISGISAGAFLSIYSVFLDQSEIPHSIPYAKCSGSPPPPISVTSQIRTDGYPMPAIKGIIPLAGGSLYNNIFNNTTHSNNTAINFMHGTCDELINQNEGRVSYKLLVDTEPMIVTANSNTLNRYPYAYGSKYLYNLLIPTHNKIGFGQVINGGHSIISLKPNVDIQKNGAWDALDVPKYETPPHVPNMGLPINQRDIVFDNISTFMKRVMGESGYPAWNNHAYSVFPDMPTSGCLSDDLSLINSPLTTVGSVCTNVNTTASITNAPSWTTITWSVSSNLQIVGSNIGTSITYKGLSAGTGTVTAIVSYGTEAYKKITLSKTVAITTLSPYPALSGANALCSGGSNTYTVSNVPAGVAVTWSATPSGIVTLVPTGNSCTVTKSGSANGPVVLNATFSACDNHIVLSKSIHAGLPTYQWYGAENQAIASSDPWECDHINLQCYAAGTVGNKTWTTTMLQGHTSVTWSKIFSVPSTGASILWSDNYNSGNQNGVKVHFRVPNASLTLKTTISNSCGSIEQYFCFATNGTQCTVTALKGSGEVLQLQEVDYYDAYMSYQTLVITYKDEEENKSELEKIIISDKMGNIILEKTDISIKENRIEINMSPYKSNNYYVILQYADGSMESQQVAKF